MGNKVVLKINWFDLCEYAWFPWQPVMRFSRMGVTYKVNNILDATYQKQQNLVPKLKPRHRPVILWSDIQIISFAY